MKGKARGVREAKGAERELDWRFSADSERVPFWNALERSEVSVMSVSDEFPHTWE